MYACTTAALPRQPWGTLGSNDDEDGEGVSVFAGGEKGGEETMDVKEGT